MQQATRSHRGLSTARAALSVTWLLARAPDGVRADEVAETLGKSVSTAYNLLASLCDEHVAERLPGGLYHLAPGFRRRSPKSPTATTSTGLVEDLLAARTSARIWPCCAATICGWCSSAACRACRSCPGMSPEIRDNAHALAMGKVVLAVRPRTRSSAT